MIVYIVWKDKWLPIIEALEDGNKFHLFSAFFLPGMIAYFVCFLIVFELATNFYAELSGLEDRQFYQDFWNSTNFDEYSRKWNKLVHEFLYRHYFLEYLIRYKLSVFQAMLWTFVFSTVFHECCFIAVFRRFTPYLSCV